MSRTQFTTEQIRQLTDNPYVAFANENRITYTEEFKKRFVSEYAAGKKPSRIFSDAGFDPEMLGGKRIERASARWRKSNNLGVIDAGVGYVKLHPDRQYAETGETVLLERIRQMEIEMAEMKQAMANLSRDK